MVPLVSQVLDASRAVLGATADTGGDLVFTDDLLTPHYRFAYSELFRAMQSSQNPRILRTNFYNVPPYTGYVAPATMGIENMGEPESIWERGGITAWNITGATPGSGICTLDNDASSLITGNSVAVYGVGGLSDDVNDSWIVTVNSSISTQLNGCAAVGTYTSGGVLSYSTEEFTEVAPRRRGEWIDRGPVTAFLVYSWEGDVIRFPPSSEVRQIRVKYTLSGNAPTATTASTGIDDCMDFLSYRIAGRAGVAHGMRINSQEWNALAVGPRWDSHGEPGGILGQLLSAGVRNLQRLPPSMRRPPAYGLNRNRRWMAW